MTQLDFALIGNASLALEAARLVQARGHRVVSFTVKDPELARMAAAQGLPLGAPADCDYLLSVANLDVLKPETLGKARRCAVNFHDGPLPERAGLNVPVWALLEGETDHAITWHRIEGGVDEGAILLRAPVPVQRGDTALTLNARCWEVALQSLPRLVEMLEKGEDGGTPQNAAPLRRHMKADRPSNAGLLDFAKPAEDVARMVDALDHGPYWNPLLRPRIASSKGVQFVDRAEPVSASGMPGTVLGVGEDHALVACATGAVRLSPIRGVTEGEVLPLPQHDAARDAAMALAARHDAFWRKRLARLAPLSVPGTTSSDQAPDWLPRTIALARPQDFDLALAAIVGAVTRMTGSTGFDIAQGCDLPESAAGHLLGWKPLAVEAEDLTLAQLAGLLTKGRAENDARGGIMADLVRRAPELSHPGIPGLIIAKDPGQAPAGCAICIAPASGEAAGIDLWIDTTRLSAAAWQPIADVIEALSAADPDQPIASAPTIARGRAAHVARNDDGPTEDAATIQETIERQIALRGDAPALVFADRQLSYAELAAQSGRLARQLAAMGVGPGDPVGIYAPRGLGLVVGALAILRAGGAYVPLDPAYPDDRIAHYLADSGAKVVVADPAISGNLPRHEARVLHLDASGPEAEPARSAGGDLAYLIYTSGSTGKPKGVMVEHRNVINFFAGMDARIPTDGEPGTWLAVTSLSFDISVLEIFWTLSRGWKVVIAGDMLATGQGVPVQGGKRSGTAFSLFYWGNDDGAGPRKYDLLLNGARFADEHGFAAVWTPERHFHAFGGPYPNPSVTGAAVAAVTRNIGVRAGSCVAPLHHPARIAEEWAVIDNLTNGRAGLAIASGWQPDDFVLRPENAPPQNKPAMIETIDQLRRLWRGEEVEFPRADGTPFAVVTQPRPVSAELPVWVTTAGNPATWREAGRLGANVLTHLLGQSVQDIAARIPEYHEALREAGYDPADFTVTLMLHSFLSDSRDEAMEVAREPMKEYLRAAAALVKQYAWAFPAFKKPQGVTDPMSIDLSTLSDEEMDGILEFAFLRYFNDSGLFGTVDDAEGRIRELQAIGVNEIACLIDYGIPSAQVMEGLRHLAVLHDRVNPITETQGDYSIAAQIERHGVTHLQATPSMARLLLEDEATRKAMRGLRMIALGGEALSPGLLSDLRASSKARILNMYGPTETTIWSAVADLGPEGVSVWLGDPIAGTSLHLRDPLGQPVGDGVAGELWIGGAGVTRGYWERPEQTAKAFVETPEGVLYRTGDLCRREADGRLVFLGRVDQQVKLRGYRIELGEIEARMASLPGVREVAVIAKAEGDGERQLTGFVTGDEGLDVQGIRTALARDLPDFMVPLRIHRLDAMPLTPNRKIDRKSLAVMDVRPAPAPAPKPVTPQPATAPAAAQAMVGSDQEAGIAALMARILGLAEVRSEDNFFTLGGHSLLAVQLHRSLRDELGLQRASITDVFRFPVLRDLAAHLSAGKAPAEIKPAAPRPVVQAAAPVEDGRQDMMAARRALRAQMRPRR
ncbi:MupA/Atu3671 family FMN-dependent luciferase-like monooxygenase [Paracoccus zeaxanthinifaciens]|uniref:MupA/Atu3671 family FMN-dependent luciferase-like monooxygenase n=1 Tax=Paracoccus zeaxanthinifaciens TaxID=187400 RepID=UPI0003B5D0F4|nr:MupA/Atu3671 family FMN-dependent luciferase-like monooxygenase [Paracoccus zeaxanthinifaciens]